MDIRTIVWVRSGGRCAICKRYLLDDDYGDVVAIGEVAHNVGRTTGPRSPRGDNALSVADRNDPSNLLLLCRDDHRRADTQRLEDRRFTVGFLERLKVDHEREIRRLTGLVSDRSTVVFRVVGAVRGAQGHVSRQQVDAALAGADRFPTYLPDSHYNRVDVDLRDLPEDVGGYWMTGAAMIDRGVARLAGAVSSGDHHHASVFAFARLPLLVYLGAALDDAYPVDVYQHHRASDSWTWPASATSVDFETTVHNLGEDPDHAVIIVNASGVIHADELPAELQALPRYEIRPGAGAPDHDLIASPASLDGFHRCFRALLTRLEDTAKSIRHLHMFLAAPVSVAVTVGRCIDPQVHPHAHVYDRTDGGYGLALDLPSPVIDKRTPS